MNRGNSACMCWKRNNRKAYPYFSVKSFGGFKTKPYLCTARTPKPLNDAQIGGRFIFIPMRIHFGKTYTRPADIVRLLKDRGLNVGDFERADMVHRHRFTQQRHERSPAKVVGRFPDDRHQGYGLPCELARRTFVERIATETKHIILHYSACHLRTPARGRRLSF